MLPNGQDSQPTSQIQLRLKVAEGCDLAHKFKGLRVVPQHRPLAFFRGFEVWAGLVYDDEGPRDLLCDIWCILYGYLEVQIAQNNRPPYPKPIVD